MIDCCVAGSEPKVRDMKKSKKKLREKIRNKPKARTSGRRSKKTVSGMNHEQAFNRPHGEQEDQGMEVMSQVILDFAAPLLDTCNDEASERKAVSLAIFVWNTALLAEDECRRTLDAYLDQCRQVMPPDELKTLSGYIDRLLETRKTLYAGNRKKITNCTFGDYGPDRHIEVGYTIE